ncbi:hypothetical protein N9M06_02030, partial [Candidatus Poseidoniales archaeon]|nr:hypothetical protein [Candidatus Poseidoniales archaeon]
MASVRSANLNKSILLVILMITMTQVGYLDSMNSLTNGEETLDSNEVISQTSAGTSVMYGNNSTWTPRGPMLTSGYHSGAAILAISDEVVLFIYQLNYNGDYCLAAYNRYNETSWTPTFDTPSGDDCSVGNDPYFLGMIGDTVLFYYDESSTQYRGDSIYAYSIANDTVYRAYRSPILSYPKESSFSSDAVMIGKNVYMKEYHSGIGYKIGVFNWDNQTHWTYDSTLPSNCTDGMERLLVVSESKLLTHCDTAVQYTTDPYIFNIQNETMYKVNGLDGVTVPPFVSSTSALVGTQLLFRANGNTGSGSEPWIYDSTNDTAWQVEDLNPGSGSSALNNMIRSGTRVLFNTGYPVANLYWYESSNNTIWQATTFTGTGTFGEPAELANGIIVFTAGFKTYFYNPANGSVWEEPGLCHDTYSPASAPCGSFKLKEVSGNTIFGIAKMNQTGTTSFGNPIVFRYRMIAFDFSNKSMQVSWNLANAPIPEANYVYTRAFALGDQLMYPYRDNTGGARVNNGTTGSTLATMIWSPPAIRVSDAWNLSKGDLISAGDPITGGVGTRYSSGVGVQNLTASAEGAELSVGVPMTNITFQYNASAASGSGSGSGTTTNGNGTTWQVADIYSGAASSNPGYYGMEILVGDTLYFDAYDASSGIELWAHDTSNASTWRVADINSGASSNPGYHMAILVGDTLYFDAYDFFSSHELWAHDTSNASTWRVADIHSSGNSNPGQYMSI